MFGGHEGALASALIIHIWTISFFLSHAYFDCRLSLNFIIFIIGLFNLNLIWEAFIRYQISFTVRIKICIHDN